MMRRFFMQWMQMSRFDAEFDCPKHLLALDDAKFSANLKKCHPSQLLYVEYDEIWTLPARFLYREHHKDRLICLWTFEFELETKHLQRRKVNQKVVIKVNQPCCKKLEFAQMCQELTFSNSLSQVGEKIDPIDKKKYGLELFLQSKTLSFAIILS